MVIPVKKQQQQQQQQQKTSKFPEARENASNQGAVGVRSASDGDAYFLDQSQSEVEQSQRKPISLKTPN